MKSTVMVVVPAILGAAACAKILDMREGTLLEGTGASGGSSIQARSGGTNAVGPLGTAGAVSGSTSTTLPGVSNQGGSGGSSTGWGNTFSTFGGANLVGGTSASVFGFGGTQSTTSVEATAGQSSSGGTSESLSMSGSTFQGGVLPVGGITATGGQAPSGGSAATGGALASGGAASGGATTGGTASDHAPSTDAGTCPNTTSTIGAKGTCCVQAGAYGCSANASKSKVVCINGIWTANGDCDSGQLCDTHGGGTAGSCQNIVTECDGKNPGDNVCNGQTVETCGPDLVTVTVAQACTGSTPTCLNGACVACSPSKTQCDPAGSNGVQTCDSGGQWGLPVTCPATTPLCNAGTCIACPGAGGPTLVGLDSNYCIDSTEVTQGQYQAWLETTTDWTISHQISACAENNTLTPSSGWPPTSSTLNYPVVNVNWCDAYAYCAGVGKRLCGKIGGGSVGYYADWFDATKSQWYSACTSNGTYSSTGYPYGDTYEPSYCNGGDANEGGTVAVGTMPECQSTVVGYTGVYDLSGNVWEWEDSCDGNTSKSDNCHIRGGAFNYGEGGACCGCYDSSYPRIAGNSFIGFRCCAP